MIFEHYERIRIVSLAGRPDRRRELLHELQKVGQGDNPKVAFFDALRTDGPGPFRSQGSHGCYLSHLQILEEAAERGENVLILQDDCEFLPSINEASVPPGCDVFYGGFLASDPDNLHDSDIIGAHFMGFSARAAREAAVYLRNLLDPRFPPDPQAAAQPDFNPAMRPPIDGACVWFRRAHPHLRTDFELVANQRASRSDVAPPRFFDRVWGLRTLAALARTIRRRFPHSDALKEANPSFVQGSGPQGTTS